MENTKYSAMVERNRKVNREKERRVLEAMDTLIEAGEKVQICRLSRTCQVSRSFFYTNPAVAEALGKARILQADMPDPPRCTGTSEAAVRRLAEEIEEKDRRLLLLEKENASLKRKLKKSDLKILKRL